MLPAFPLFRLPALAYFHVIKLMAPTEKVTFSFCSRITYSLVKHPRNKLSKSKIFLRHPICPEFWNEKSEKDDSFRVLILASERRQLTRETTGSLEIKGHQVPFLMAKKDDGQIFLETYWDEQTIGRFAILDYVRELFQCNVYSLTLYIEHRSHFFPIYRRQAFIERIRIIDPLDWGRLTPENLKFILVNAETNFMFIDLHMGRDFRIENYRKKMDVFTVKKGIWVTLDNMKTVDSEQIQIEGRNISNEDLNSFLMHWINGGSDRLKFFSVDVREYNEDIALAGIEIVNRYSGPEAYSKRYGSKIRVHGMEIRRSDGIKAAVEYSIWKKCFTLAVWPDALGLS